MKLRKLTTLLLGAFLFFYSCEQPMNDTGKDSTGPAALSPGETGELTLSVPLISSALRSTLEPAEPVSRAYLFAKEVALILLDSAGSEVSRTEASFPGGSLDNPGATLTAQLEVPWGQNYTVRVQILDGTPTGTVLVEGESAPFDMGFTRVSLSLSLLPADPTVLTAPGSLSGTLTSSVYGTDSFTSMGEEAWFSLTPSSAELSVLTVETEGEALLFQADSQGAFIESAGEHDSTQPTVLTASLDGGEKAYAGLIILGDTPEAASYTLNYQSVQNGIVRMDLTGMDSETGSPLSLEIIPSGGTEAAAVLSTTLTGSIQSLYVFEGDGLNLWEGTGEYTFRYLIDKDGSGEADRDDLVLTRTVNLASGENSLTVDLADFAPFIPDITGRWYSLNDESDLNPAYLPTEIIADINEDGTFAVYARRHQADWDTTNLDPDAFLPIMAGTWLLEGYEITAEIVTANIFNFSVLNGSLDDAYYAMALLYTGLTKDDMLSYDETMAVITPLISLLGDNISVDTDALAAVFQTFTETMDDVAATASDSSSVTGYGATIEVTDLSGNVQTRTYSLLDTYLATDLGNESFRTPLIFP